jgi:hypothetical protein
VTRLAIPAVALLLGLAVAGPVRAQNGDLPTELWSEYPLKPKVEQAAPSLVGPFLPPAGGESPRTDQSSGSSYWLPLLAVVAIALLVATPFLVPLAASGAKVVDRRVGALRGRTRRRLARPTRQARSRSPTRSPGRTGSSRLPIQYAPVSVAPNEVEAPQPVPVSVAPNEVEAPQPVPYITRRSGLVRSRYVVVTADSGRALRQSRAFWRIGGAVAQRRRAEAAWDDLANDLRADGWELDTAGRYEYYVPLRRALVSTLEPYSRASPSDSPEAEA